MFPKRSVVRWRSGLRARVFPSVSDRLVRGRRSFPPVQQQARQAVNYLIVFIISGFKLGEGEEKTERIVPVFGSGQVFGFPGPSPDIRMFAGWTVFMSTLGNGCERRCGFFYHEVVSRCRGKETLTRVQIPGLPTKFMRTGCRPN